MTIEENPFNPGFRTVTEEMPYEAGRLRLPRYVLPETIGRAESEEAACRLMSFSQDEGRWVGVPTPTFFKRMIEEYELQQEFNRIRKENYRRSTSPAATVKRNWFLTILTLGFYGRIESEPVESLPPLPEPTGTVPFTLANLMGPQPIVNGMHELAQKGLVRIVSETDDDGAGTVDVVYPTPALAEFARPYARA